MADFTLESMASFLLSTGAAMPMGEKKALAKAAELVEAEAKAEIGHYQDAAGAFAAWPTLAESTRLGRMAQGYSEDDPLLRSGEMQDSIGSVVLDHEAHVGSNDDKAVWQELGTSRIPARSFLGGAAVRKSAEVKEIIGHTMVGTLLENPEYAIGSAASIPIK